MSVPTNPTLTTAPGALLEALAGAGRDLQARPPTAEDLAAFERYQRHAREAPAGAAVQLMRAREEQRRTTRQRDRAMAGAEELRDLLANLLTPRASLARLEDVVLGGAGGPSAICHVNGQLRQLGVHPDVSPERLLALEPWHLVRVHPEEPVVVGICEAPFLFGRALGEVVEFKGYFDADRGLAVVARPGHDETVVRLAPSLRELELAVPARLVLMRGDESFAVAVADGEVRKSRFEVDPASLSTRFSDLAGLDSIVAPIVEDVLLRLVHPDVGAAFDLRPLRGMLLVSYKPGMGKTTLVRAMAGFLADLGHELGFDFALYHVPPNALKSHWHGGDAKLVREDLCGAIRARQRAQPAGRKLIQLCVLDEIDALGRRGGDARVTSSASNDAVQALLAELDGLEAPSDGSGDGHVLYVGLTNRPDLLDEALKRPGRFGDLVREMPALTREAVVGVMAVHAGGSELPWFVDGAVRTDLARVEVRERLLAPAVARLHDLDVLRYSTDGRAHQGVTAGELLASVHYMEAVNQAKKAAAQRRLRGVGAPAVRFEDVLRGLVDQAASAARQAAADHELLERQLRLEVRVQRAQAVPEEELLALVGLPVVEPTVEPATQGGAA